MSALHKILVVDDDPVVGMSFNRVLSSDKGYVVITAQNAAQALEKLREQEYDVVFTDIKMPGMDGVELAERVRAKQPWTPVVIVTGHGTNANEKRAKAAGVLEFLNKPLSPEMIEKSAMNALHQPELAVVHSVQPSPVKAPPIESAARTSNVTKLVLLVAAPFIGLIYAVSLPLIGMGMLLWTAGQALVAWPVAKKALHFLKNVALFLAAPFIGLAYAVMLPFVGMAMLIWAGLEAWKRKSDVKQ
jgi:CheY-like chemotaxis protein